MLINEVEKDCDYDTKNAKILAKNLEKFEKIVMEYQKLFDSLKKCEEKL